MPDTLYGFVVIVAIVVIAVLVTRWFSQTVDESPVVLKYKLKGTYVEVWSPQVPGGSGLGASVEPAIGSFIMRHGTKLGIDVESE